MRRKTVSKVIKITLQLRFDFDSTAVRQVFDCLIKGHRSHSDVTR